MPKSEVYSWRLSRELKHRLTVAAREQKVSLAELLEAISAEWLRHQHDEANAARQRALQEALAPSLGSISGDDPDRSERIGELVRQKLEDRRRANQG